MGLTVEVRFKGTRKAYFLWSGGEPLRVGEPVIVEAERGRDLGHVTAVGEVAEKKCGGCSGCSTAAAADEPEPLKKVLQRAAPEDVKSHADVRRSEEEIRRIVSELLAQRKKAQPTDKRTFGSVFKNPEHDLSAGEILEACGLRGTRIGGAQISKKHANFIENVGGARTADVLALIEQARQRAYEQFGVVLVPEVQLLGDIEIPALDPA